MSTTDHHDIEVAAGLMAAAGVLDPHLKPCPRCGASELRAEARVEWRPIAEVCDMMHVTPADLRASGAKVTALGMVKCGVPYVTCMACGLDADGSKEAFL